MEIAEDIRHTLGMKQLYGRRKENMERIFGSAKEYHGFRYTNMIGKARIVMKAALTFACIHLKKLARILEGKPSKHGHSFCCFKLLGSIQLLPQSSGVIFQAA